MGNDQRLIALVNGEDPGVLAYAAMLGRQHARGAARPVSPATAGPTTVLVREPSLGCLSLPRELRYAQVPRRRQLSRLLELSAQEDTGLLVVPESAGRRLARGLACGAACSVWFVPAGARLRLQRLLVPVDYSVRAADGMRVATGLASLSGGCCLSLNVDFNDAVLTPGEPAADRARRHASEYVRFIEGIDCLKVPVTPVFEEDADIARAIVRAAEQQDADLIVLPSRGRTRLGNWLRPSIADRVLRDSRVPVLVVKHFGARLGLWPLLRETPDPASRFLPCN